MRMKGKGVLLLSETIFLVSLVFLLINGSESRHDVRRRSHQHLSVCRKEFLRPLDKRIADVDLVFTGVVERIYQDFESSSSGDDDLGSGGGERRRRQHQVAAHHRRHHRHHHRSHRQHDVVRSFSQSEWNPGSAAGSAGSGNSVSIHYRGIVRVKRIIRGDKRFQGKRVIVEGFGSDKFCVSDAKERDTRIFFANPILNGRLRIHSSLMHVNVENLRKVYLATKGKLNDFGIPSSIILFLLVSHGVILSHLIPDFQLLKHKRNRRSCRQSQSLRPPPLPPQPRRPPLHLCHNHCNQPHLIRGWMQRLFQ